MRCLKIFWALFYIFLAVEAAIANNQAKDYLDPMTPEDSIILWRNLFNNINTIIKENSKLNDNLEKLNARQNDQEIKFTNFMEKMETQFMDLKDRDKDMKKFMENVDQKFEDLNKGLDDHKHHIEDLNKGQDELKSIMNQFMENIQYNFKDLQKGQEDYKESTTQFANSAKRHFEKLEKEHTEHSQNLRNLTDQYMSNSNEWITILRRQDGSVDFNRNWTEYKNGFGNPNGEFFIGLEKLHKLTTDGASKELMIILRDFEYEQRLAKYDNFRIGNESEKYILQELGTYSGNARDSLSTHKGMMFSTYDQDNDTSDSNCANIYKGGWWYYNCFFSNLCGIYRKRDQEKMHRVRWNSWKGDSLKYAEMKIRSSYL